MRARSPLCTAPHPLALLRGAALVVLVAVGAATATPADAATTAGASTSSSGADNVAVAVNGQDGRTVYSVRLKIVQTDAAVVDPTNAAVAAASCVDCTTVAIALEGVLVYGDGVTQVTPVNLALALNTECTGCLTVAEAYQKVVQRDGRVRLTGDGRRTIASLRQDLETMRLQDLTVDQIAAEVERITTAFASVLENDVLPVGRPATAGTAAPGMSTATG